MTTMNDDIVERVARAIHDHACDGDPEAGCSWFEDGCESCDLTAFHDFARAALDAMESVEREVTGQSPAADLSSGHFVMRPDTAEHPRTVGELRAAIKDLPDGAQMFVNVSGQGEDYAVEEVWASEQISDGEPWPTDKRTIGLEIHLALFPELSDADEVTA